MTNVANVAGVAGGENMMHKNSSSDGAKKRLTVKAWTGVYWPAEDSELLLATLLEKGKGDLLEIGCGSGYVCLNYAWLKGQKATCADISAEALSVAERNAKEHGIEDVCFIRSDLFNAIPDDDGHKYSTIAFNPPYLSKEEDESFDITLHDEGIIERYMEEVGHYLKEGGAAFLLVSSAHKRWAELHSALKEKGWQKLAEKPAGYWEKLSVWRVEKMRK